MDAASLALLTKPAPACPKEKAVQPEASATVPAPSAVLAFRPTHRKTGKRIPAVLNSNAAKMTEKVALCMVPTATVQPVPKTEPRKFTNNFTHTKSRNKTRNTNRRTDWTEEYEPGRPTDLAEWAEGVKMRRKWRENNDANQSHDNNYPQDNNNNNNYSHAENNERNDHERNYSSSDSESSTDVPSTTTNFQSFRPSYEVSAQADSGVTATTTGIDNHPAVDSSTGPSQLGGTVTIGSSSTADNATDKREERKAVLDWVPEQMHNNTDISGQSSGLGSLHNSAAVSGPVSTPSIQPPSPPRPLSPIPPPPPPIQLPIINSAQAPIPPPPPQSPPPSFDFQAKLDAARAIAAALTASMPPPETDEDRELREFMESLEDPSSGEEEQEVKQTGMQFAQNLMKKQGYVDGQGLGAAGHGRTEALTLTTSQQQQKKQKGDKKNANTPVVSALEAAKGHVLDSFADKERVENEIKFGKTSRTVQLSNMVALQDVDDTLASEIGEECGRYGVVQRVTITPTQTDVRILVRFSGIAGAHTARTALDNRFFGGRKVEAKFVPDEIMGS